jgi:1-acyl-sn-glycerol-3-phosphate acyltransferase
LTPRSTRTAARVRRRSASPGGSVAGLQRRIDRLQRELAHARDQLALERSTGRRDGLLVTAARLVQSGLHGLTWQNLARLQAALYFSWHAEELDEFGYDPVFAETIRPVFEFLYRVWWRVEAVGVENLPARGPGLVVANHSGVLPYDGAMLKLAIRHHHPARRECRMLMLDMFALLPVLAPTLTKHGEIRASADNAERVLRSGELIGVFPEGVKGVGKYFRDRYRLARFGRGGFVRVALRTGAPIIPCAVVGAEEIHPVLARADWIGRPLGLPYFPITPTFPWLGALGLIPLPSRWSIHFAAPLDTRDFGPEDADDPILVNRLAEQVRATIQQMIDGRLARRRSLWFG